MWLDDDGFALACEFFSSYNVQWRKVILRCSPGDGGRAYREAWMGAFVLGRCVQEYVVVSVVLKAWDVQLSRAAGSSSEKGLL